MNTFNKVWIVPEKAVVYENAKAGTAYVVESRLKVMLEQDYLSLQKYSSLQADTRSAPTKSIVGAELVSARTSNINSLGSQITREIVIPQLTNEVNDGKNFAQLRQVYNSLILATWYKKKIKDSILELVFADRNKVLGVNIDDPQEKQRIYERYLRAFKKGVFNYIKEESLGIPGMISKEQGIFSRKYFSGGLGFTRLNVALEYKNDISDKAMISNERALLVSAGVEISNFKQINSLTMPPDVGLSAAVSKEIKNQAMLTRRQFLTWAFAAAAAAFVPTERLLAESTRKYDNLNFTAIPLNLPNSTLILQGSKDWDAVQGFLKSAMNEAVSHNDKQSLIALKSFHEASLNGLYDVEAGGMTNVIYDKNLRPVQCVVGINLKSFYQLISNKKGIYPKIMTGIFIKEGATVDDVKRRPELYQKLRVLEVLQYNKQKQMSDSDLKKYVAVWVEVETVGMRSMVPYLIKTLGGFDPAYLQLMSLADHETDLSLKRFVYFLIYYLFSTDADKRLSKEDQGLYLRTAVYLTIVWLKLDPTSILQLEGELYNDKNVPIWLRDLSGYTHKNLQKLLRPMEFLNDWDKAQIAPVDQVPVLKGGIDLSPVNHDLQTQNAGQAVKFHIDPTQLAQLQNAPGFVPVIISIEPLPNIKEFLGITLAANDNFPSPVNDNQLPSAMLKAG